MFPSCAVTIAVNVGPRALKITSMSRPFSSIAAHISNIVAFALPSKLSPS
jgi:hypothetical protein